jgi:pyridoxine 5-phosphate synthase
MVRNAAETGTDRIELYTEAFAKGFGDDADKAVAPYVLAAKAAEEVGLGLNAGHDLNLENIEFFRREVPHLQEVSIGHALICESLYLGLENVINMYQHKLS